jgi:hypothetical protein
MKFDRQPIMLECVFYVSTILDEFMVVEFVYSSCYVMVYGNELLAYLIY